MNIENLMEDFEKAAKDITDSGLSLNNDDLLGLYGYYKQVTVGDCNIECPSFWDPKGKAKYEAWIQHKGMTKEHAIKRYIKKVRKILEK